MKNEDLKIEDEQYMKEIIHEIFVREE